MLRGSSIGELLREQDPEFVKLVDGRIDGGISRRIYRGIGVVRYSCVACIDISLDDLRAAEFTQDDVLLFIPNTGRVAFCLFERLHPEVNRKGVRFRGETGIDLSLIHI